MQSVSVEGLTREQIERVQRYVDAIRRPRQSREEAQATLSELVGQLQPPFMPENDSDVLVAEAIREVRGR